MSKRRATPLWQRVLSLLLLYWGVFSCVHAQPHYFTNYNIDKGLAQSQVYAICEDSRGYLWMGTAGGGISLFDGTTFRTVTTDDGLMSNDVYDIVEDRRGLVWMGHQEGGLSVYDGWKIRSVATRDSVYFSGETSLGLGTDGSLWVGTRGKGVYRYDGKRYQHYRTADGLPDDSVNCIAAARDGGAWIGTAHGLGRWKDGHIRTQIYRGLDNEAAVTAVLEDRRGTLWVGQNNRLYYVQGDSAIHAAQATETGELQEIFEDSKGRIWLAGNLGLGVMDGTNYTHFHNEEGLWDIGTYCVIEDSYGNIWIGTEGGGVSRYSVEAFELFGQETALGQRAPFAIEEIAPQHLWIGTEKGLFSFRGDSIAPVKGFPEPEMEIYDILKAKSGDVYLSGLNRLYRYAGGRFEELAEGTPMASTKVYTVAEDAEGTIWVASGRGAFVVNGDKVTQMEERLLRKAQQQIFIDRHARRRWHVNHGRGVTLYERGWLKAMDLPYNYANSRGFFFAEDSHGKKWMATREGLIRWNDNDFCYLSPREGMVGSVIYILQPDRAGNLWAGTERGLNHILLDANSEPIAIRTYGPDEGFKGQECNQGASLIDSAGNLWLGTIYGLCRYNPKHDFRPAILPKLAITSLKVHLEDVDWSRRGMAVEPWTNLPVNPRLGTNENHIRFEFKAATMWRPEKVRYKYRLRGLDDQWTEASLETHASFPALPSGSYAFEVKAGDGAGRWTESVVFPFSIRTPIYKTWWFLLLVIGGVFVSVYATVRIRLRNASRIRERLERKVKERTEELEKANQVKSEFLAKMSHEIRTPMNGVIGMTDLLRRSSLDARQRKFVENIRISGQNLLSLINDILDFSRIESGKMELEHVAVDLRQLIEEVLDILAYGAYAKKLELLAWIDPEIRGPVLGDAARLKQILVNLVGNAIKFTEKGRVIVSAKLLQKDEQTARFQFSVKDSGIGIPKNKHGMLFESFSQVDASTNRKYGGTGLGLAISYNLSRMMGGDMWVESEHGEGSEFLFTITAGLSAPWKNPVGDHPALKIELKHVASAVADRESCAILERYLRHWQLETYCFSSFAGLSDALLDDPKLEFFVLDTRLLPADADPRITIKQFAEACKLRGKRFAILSDPELAIDLQEMVNEYGWVINKPWKRDDLLHALLGEREPSRIHHMAAEEEAKFASQHPLDVLIAEDNPINMEVAQGMLRTLGYTPRGAEDGRQALAEVARQRPDVIFMDVQMPGMDGLEATAELIRLYGPERPKIVAMTANAMESDRQRCLVAGMDTFISKPFMMEELVHLLQWVVQAAVPDKPVTDPTNAHTTEVSAQVAAEGPAMDALDGMVGQSGVQLVEDNGHPITDLTMLEAASGGEPAFVISILGKLVAKLPEAVQELREAASKSEWETVRATAHRTKSSAAYSGADILRDAFKELEVVARERNRLEEVPVLLDQLEALVVKVVKELEVHLERLEG